MIYEKVVYVWEGFSWYKWQRNLREEIMSVSGFTSLEDKDVQIARTSVLPIVRFLNDTFQRIGLDFREGKAWTVPRDSDLRVSIHVRIPLPYTREREEWERLVAKIAKVLESFAETKKKALDRETDPGKIAEYLFM